MVGKTCQAKINFTVHNKWWWYSITTWWDSKWTGAKLDEAVSCHCGISKTSGSSSSPSFWHGYCGGLQPALSFAMLKNGFICLVVINALWTFEFFCFHIKQKKKNVQRAMYTHSKQQVGKQQYQTNSLFYRTNEPKDYCDRTIVTPLVLQPTLPTD